MRVARWHIDVSSRSDVYTIVPLYDLHIGSAACDEKGITSVVSRIKSDPLCYWIGGGDMCEYINMRDRRFDATMLPEWLNAKALADLAKAQRDRLLDYLKPIANKCIAILSGNHENSIRLHYERDVHAEFVAEIKSAGKFKADSVLGLGVYGWCLLNFRRTGKQNKTGSSGVPIVLNLHHGFTNGRLEGAKALNMQRWLWTHECDVALQGHSHNLQVQAQQIESVNQNGVWQVRNQFGAYCGSFLRGVLPDSDGTYTERAGYLPQGAGRIEVRIRPGAHKYEDRLTVKAILAE